MISTEWVHTVATGIPVYASAGLVVWGQGWLWRKALWDEHGPALRALEPTIGGQVAPTWTGWRIRGPGADFRLAGGLRGAQATLRVGSQRTGWAGMPAVHVVEGALTPAR